MGTGGARLASGGWARDEGYGWTVREGLLVGAGGEAVARWRRLLAELSEQRRAIQLPWRWVVTGEYALVGAAVVPGDCAGKWRCLPGHIVSGESGLHCLGLALREPLNSPSLGKALA